MFSPLRRRVTKKASKDSEPLSVNLPPSVVISRSISTCDFVSDGERKCPHHAHSRSIRSIGSSADFNDNISVLVADGHDETYSTSFTLMHPQR